MRTAFYYPSSVPPREWLLHASLLWDRIHIASGLREILTNRPEYATGNADAAFILRLLSDTTICSEEFPQCDKSNLPEEQQAAWDTYYDGACAALDKILEDSDENVTTGKQFAVTTDQMITLQTLMSKVGLNPRFAPAFPNMDFFFADQPSFLANSRPSGPVVLKAVEAVLPQLPSDVSVSQLESFRTETMLQRERFRGLLAAELQRFNNISTEAEFIGTTHRLTECLRDQLALLEVRCQQHKLDTVKRVFGLTLAAPAAIQVLNAVLAVPILQPAAVMSALSLAAADYLAAREKHQIELRAAPWAYLLSLKSL